MCINLGNIIWILVLWCKGKLWLFSFIGISFTIWTFVWVNKHNNYKLNMIKYILWRFSRVVVIYFNLYISAEEYLFMFIINKSLSSLNCFSYDYLNINFLTSVFWNPLTIFYVSDSVLHTVLFYDTWNNLMDILICLSDLCLFLLWFYYGV